VPIVCTLQGEDLFLEQLREPWRSQALALIRQKVNDVDRFIAVSDYYLGFMSKYLGVAPDRMRKVPIGISLDGHEVRRAYDDRPFTIGFFARIAPEKGLHVLADAYIRLRARSNAPPTRLFIGGYLLSEHREYFNGVMRQLEKAGLASHVRYAGAPTREDKIRLMHGMDVMSMPATYDEPKGLSLLEAMANGVPVVEPRRAPRAAGRSRRACGRAALAGARSPARRHHGPGRRRRCPASLHCRPHGGRRRARVCRTWTLTADLKVCPTNYHADC
jgi:glycosyltransferase involved in cell wall biosynthesis